MGSNSNSLRITNNTDAADIFTIENGGNVGIGTTSVYSKLTISVPATNTISTADSSNTAGLTISGTGNLVRLQFGVGSSTLGPYGGWIQASYDNTGGNDGIEPLLLNPSGGSIGIGTSSPSQLVEAYKSANSDIVFKITNPNTGSIATAQYYASNGTTQSQFFHTGTNFSGAGVLNYAGLGGIYNSATGISLAATNASGVILFGTGTSATERMRIAADGNVGIGTSSPSRLLQVNGTAYVSGDVEFANNLNLTNNLILGSGGNIGINSTIPTEKLDVVGNIAATGNIVSVGDSIVILNGDFTGSAPSENAGIEVERGTQTNTLLIWNEGTDRWTFTNDGSTYYNIPVTSELTLDATTTNGASTSNDIVVGGITVSGAAQAKSDHFVVYCNTSNSTTTEMFLNGTNGRITLASNSAVAFKGNITAFDSANAKAASWSYNCLVANKAGNTALVGAAHVIKLGDDSNGVWEVFVDGDNTNDSLKLQVKGENAANIKWTASVISSVVS